MPVCQNCKENFSNRVVENGQEYNLSKRTYCLKCNPRGERRFWGGKRAIGTIENGKRVLKLRKFICKQCGRPSSNKTRNLVCGTCRRRDDRHKQRTKAIYCCGGKCIVCGYNFSEYALDFHHLKHEKKLFNLSSKWARPWGEIENELKKCVLLCSNCHAIYHANIFCLLIEAPDGPLRKSQKLIYSLKIPPKDKYINHKNSELERAKKNDEFKKKAIKVHGNKFDYSKIKYLDARTKIEITCKEHGTFWQRPNDHLRSHGCPGCGRAIMIFKNRKRYGLVC